MKLLTQIITASKTLLSTPTYRVTRWPPQTDRPRQSISADLAKEDRALEEGLASARQRVEPLIA
jgi:hypothetical protein